MFELFVWGSESEIAKFAPESLAAALYIKLAIKDTTKYKIVASRNSLYYDAMMYNFPFLKDTANDGKVIEGYANITKYLKKINLEYDLDQWLQQQQPKNNNDDNNSENQNNELLNLGLVNFIMNKLILINYYNYFLNKQNYDKYTVQMFKFYLPFPLQYYLPLRLKENLTAKCNLIGLTPMKSTEAYNVELATDKINKIENELNLPTLGHVHTELQKQRLKNLQLLKETSANFRTLTLVQQYLKKIDINDKFSEFSPILDDSDHKELFTFGDKITSADILLIANVVAATNDKVPDQFLNNLLQLKFAKLVSLANSFRNIKY